MEMDFREIAQRANDGLSGAFQAQEIDDLNADIVELVKRLQDKDRIIAALREELIETWAGDPPDEDTTYAIVRAECEAEVDDIIQRARCA